jgi:hypothetical protein
LSDQTNDNEKDLMTVRVFLVLFMLSARAAQSFVSASRPAGADGRPGCSIPTRKLMLVPIVTGRFGRQRIV